MYTLLKEIAFVIKATYLVNTTFGKNGCNAKPLSSVETRPVGEIYYQLTVITPNQHHISYELIARRTDGNFDKAIQELLDKGLLFALGKVQSTTLEKYRPAGLVDIFDWKNYFLA